MHLRNLGILGLLLLFAAGKCTAQVNGENYHGHAYAYVAPAGFTAGGNTLTAIALGAGGEAMLYKGLAAGADINQSGANLANYGAGFQYWFKERWALRVEGRDHINTSGPVAHAWQVRFAIVFR